MAQKEQSASATNVKLEATASMFGQLPFMPVPMMNTGMFNQALEAESPAAKKRKRPLPATARVPVPTVGAFNMPQCFQAALLSQQQLLQQPAAQLPAAPAPAAAAAAEPDDKDLTPAERKERRRIRNRVSAQLHRERQRQHVDGLEQQVIVKDAELAALRAQIAGLTAANAALQQRVRELEADAAAAAALSAAADSAVCCALAEVDFMDDAAECGNSSSDEATVLAGYSDSGGMTDGGTTSESHEESGDSSGLDSDMEDGVGGLWQQQSLEQPALARLNSYEAFQRTHLDDVQLDMSMFDDDTVLQEEGITINSSSSIDNSSSSDAEHSSSSRGGVSVGSRAGSAASLAFLSLMCVCTFMGGKYSSSSVSSVPAVTQRIAWAQDSSAASSKSVAVAGAGSPRHRVLRTAEDIASGAAAAAATDDSSSRRRVDLQRAVQRSDAAQQQQRKNWVFSPAEKEPAVWRASVARQGLAPWSYTRALDLFNTAAGGRWLGADAQSSMGNKQQHQRSRRNRDSGAAAGSSSTATGPTGLDVDIYTGGNRGVDLYRGDAAEWESVYDSSSSSGSAAQSGAAVRSGIDAASPADKSYLYCPSAHGMMGPRMVAHAARAAYAAPPAAATSTPSAKTTVPSAEALAERAVVLQQYPHLRGGGAASGASQQGTGGAADAGSVTPADQYLTLLVPSGSVDWGRMSEGMSSFNSTAAEGGASEGWLEIGCQIMHARVVQGVSFTV
jgi:Basic region leucine zipper